MISEALPTEYKRFPSHWKILLFSEAFEDKTGGQTKIQKGDYLNDGLLPIVDQGQSLFGGFTNDPESVCKIELPCILFGDHTKTFKFIEKPFALGADGVKVLKQRNDIEPKFAFHYLNTLTLPDVGYSRHFRFLKRTFFPIPPLAEQRRIAAILDKADAVRRKRQEAIALTEELLRSGFLEMFGDPATNSKAWDVLPMYKVIQRIEAGWSANGEDCRCKENEWGVLKISAVTSGRFQANEHKVVEDIAFKKSLIIPQRGDLLFSRANTRELVAATCLVEKNYERLFLPDKLWRITPDPNIANSEYLRFLLTDSAYRRLITRKATGTSGSMLNVSQAKLLEMYTPIPPLSIQKHFAEVVWQAFHMRERHELAFAMSDSAFNSLLQKAFQGEL